MGKKIPDEIEEWLGPITYDFKTYPNSNIKGVSITTGSSRNKISQKVKDFVVNNTTKNHLIVAQDPEDNAWGCMAISFEKRSDAETFVDLVEECGAHLRLSSGDFGDWFAFEAE